MRWIDLATGIYPQKGETVLVCDKYSSCKSIAIYYDEECDYEFSVLSLDCIEPDFNVTHWMSFPELPAFFI